MGDRSGGYVVGKYYPVEEENRSRRALLRYYPYLAFVPSLMICLVVILIPGEGMAAARDIILMYMMPVVILVSIASFIVIQNTFKRKLSPIIIYSDGIGHDVGLLDRMMRVPDFMPKEEITSVEIIGMGENMNVDHALYISVRIIRKQGRPNVVGAMPSRNAKDMIEAIEQNTQVPVDRKVVGSPRR